ncbi:MAG: NADH-quinone oxidoreductase subunit C [Acidobacteria bacterium]|nr:NADH-quinone oxidoreductase subunit C [Acidobacteriota bacterium]
MGAWRLRVSADDLLRVVGGLIRDLGGKVLLAAGEDGPAAGGMSAHYLIGVTRASEGGPPSDRWELVHLTVDLPRRAPAVPSLATLSFPASRFEREMRDMLGITPAAHPDPRPLVRHGFWPDTFYPLRHDAVVPTFEDDGRPFPFRPVEGEGVYEIPVGPVHAGVIEPGHFRFNVLGETILKMRARLYFTHKGTERLFVGRLPADAVPLAERVSGDTSVGHALAFCQAVESLAGVEVPRRAKALRTLLLELERLYNHITDVGAIIADTGFPVGQMHCLRLREALLRLHKRITGHRLLRGAIVPGGVRGLESVDGAIVGDVDRVVADFEEVVQICLANTLVSERLERTGRLPADVARDFGVVGYVARACGVAHDVRRNVPFAAYEWIDVAPVVEAGGDVQARLLVRVREAREAARIIAVVRSDLDSSPLRVDLGALAPFTAGFGIVEAWRGRLAHMAMADEDGRLHRVKIVDPSFFNWPALSRALEDNIVPDFPLCNKSFNQSYSGNDL